MRAGSKPESAFEYTARGTPAPGGSKRVIFQRDHRGRIKYRDGMPLYSLIDDGKHNAEWRRDVARQATIAMAGRQPFLGPLRLVIEFRIGRPQYHHDKTGAIKPRHDGPHIARPDTTKLLRSTEDALTGIVWKDDAQIIQQHAIKRWVQAGEQPGARIKVTAPTPF